MKINKKYVSNGVVERRTTKITFANRINNRINILLDSDNIAGEVRRDGLRGTNYICSLRDYSVIPVEE